jgi:hypothetical protein
MVRYGVRDALVPYSHLWELEDESMYANKEERSMHSHFWAWKHIDNLYLEFAYDPRNVRFGLASDGFNLFGKLNVTYTTWHVIPIPNNWPPCLCLKQ